jgi:hypothetical protein
MDKLLLILMLLSTSVYANKMACKKVAHLGTAVYRCQNKEVLCYISNMGGIVCKFKPVKK